MDEVKDAVALTRGVSAPWKSFDLAKVNGQNVRLRVMEDRVSEWHVHPESDEAFFVLDGTFNLDTESGTRTIGAGQFGMASAGERHRGRVEGRATMLVIDDFATR